MRSTQLTALAVMSLGLASCAPQTTPADTLNISGSDTEVQMVSTLAEAFKVTHAEASVSVAGGGSSVGIAALLNRETDIANSSRKMKDVERKTAADKGLQIQEFIVARDGLAVIVNPGNPLTTLTMQQLGAIYKGEITNWKDVGGADAPIVLYGRQSTSGTFTFFRDTVLQGDYSSEMRQMEGNQAIVDGVVADRNGIGYVGVGYAKDAAGTMRGDLKVVTVSANANTPAISALDIKAVKEGRYPIFRKIYQYIGNAPAKDSLAAQFLAFEVSAEGQALVEKSGFYSLSAEDIASNTAFFNALQPE
jgi:phosphate transport system substrate-binding protein